MNFLILAAGLQTRFAGHRKQMVPIRPDLPLMVDTIQKFKDHGLVAVAIQAGDWLFYAEEFPGDAVVNIPKTISTADTINQALPAMPKGDVTILLGDVFYEESAVERIVDSRRSYPVRYYTDTADFFAVGINRHAMEFALGLARIAAAEHREIGPEKGAWGKIWSMFHIQHEIPRSPVRFDAFKKSWINKSVVTIGGRTQDFDRWEDYEEWMQGGTKNEVTKGYAAKRFVD